MEITKSRFAEEYDCCFYGNGTFCKLQIDFDCLVNGKWEGKQTEPQENVREVFKAFKGMGYNLFLDGVPNTTEALEWLDETFGYGFICNDNPYHYADTGDHWTCVSRSVSTSLCYKGGWLASGRSVKFSDNWESVLNIIKENDILVNLDKKRV